jgi:type III pantothenate kinase
VNSRALVVDMGNTRLKWGLCDGAGVADSVSLPPDEAAWERQLQQWQLTGPLWWAIASVQPARRQRFMAWAGGRGDAVRVLEDPKQLPLRVLVEHPEWVGIDRLLDAVAANHRRQPGRPAVLIDAGSAVTVDWVDEEGAFRGGSIFPGLRLMAQALHERTALLPLVEVSQPRPAVPATSTPAAMVAGIYWAAVGGIRALAQEMAAGTTVAPHLFLTGGDAPLLAPALEGPDVRLWPTMTLEGLRLVTESLA